MALRLQAHRCAATAGVFIPVPQHPMTQDSAASELSALVHAAATLDSEITRRRKAHEHVSSGRAQKRSKNSRASVLELEALDLLKDCFTVKNNSVVAKDLTGVSVRSVAGGQRFDFPDAMLLASHGRATVWSGSHSAMPLDSAVADSAHVHLFWSKQFKWRNSGDTAVLCGPGGQETDRLKVEEVIEQRDEFCAAQSTTRIVHLGLRDELVVIENAGASTQELGGWSLMSETGKQRFCFGADDSVAPGGTVSISSGPRTPLRAQQHRAGTSTWLPPRASADGGVHGLIAWTRAYKWNCRGDTASLVNPAGQEVHRRCAMPCYKESRPSGSSDSEDQATQNSGQDDKGAGSTCIIS